MAASRTAHQPGRPVAEKWVRVKAMTVSQASRGVHSFSAGRALSRQPRR